MARVLPIVGIGAAAAAEAAAAVPIAERGVACARLAFVGFCAKLQALPVVNGR